MSKSFHHFFRRHALRGAAPAMMTSHELAAWTNAGLDEKQHGFRLAFARRVLVARDGLDDAGAAAALVAAGVQQTYVPKILSSYAHR